MRSGMVVLMMVDGSSTQDLLSSDGMCCSIKLYTQEIATMTNFGLYLSAQKPTMMSQKWADYLVTAVKYDEKRRITGVRQHKDDGGELGEGSIIDRSTLASNIKKGIKYTTVFSTKTKWRAGSAINCFRVGSEVSIRTDSNRVKYDLLSMLPELE